MTGESGALNSIRNEITLRTATPGDRQFLVNLFASTRTQELALLDSLLAQQFVEMQFAMQQRSYEASYPAAENKIVLLADQPIGRLLVERSPQDILLVDIALLSDHRNQGIGSALIEELMNEAASSRKPLRLSVYSTNPALQLYERLGFSKVGQDSLYIAMQWAPGAQLDDSSQP